MALELRKTITGAHTGSVLCITYKTHGREIVSSGEDSVIRVWDSETGKLVRTLHGHAGWVTGLHYVQEFRVLVSCGVDGKVIMWGSAGNLMKEISTGGPLHCLTWNAKHHQVIVGGTMWVRIFGLERVVGDGHATIEMKRVWQRKLHKDVVRCAVTGDGKLFTGSYDRSVCILDLDHREVQQYMRDVHTAGITVLAYDPDNGFLISGSFDSTVKVWSPEGKVLHKIDGFSGTLTGLCYVPVTKTLWITSASEYPSIYDARVVTNITDFIVEDKPLHYYRDPDKLVHVYTRLFYVTESAEILGVMDQKNVVVWRYNRKASTSILRAHTDVVENLTLSYEDGALQIFSGGADCQIRKWEPQQLNPALFQNDVVANHGATVLCSVFLQDLGMLITGGEDSFIRIWNFDAGPRQHEGGFKGVLDEHRERVTGLAAVQHLIISVSWDCSVRIWDVLTGHQAHVIANAHDDGITDVAYCAEFDEFATSSLDSTAKVWCFATRKLVAILAGHRGDVIAVRWNKIHKHWVTGSEDATVRVWSRDGQQLQVLPSNEEPVTALAIDENFGWILAATADKVMTVFDPVQRDVLQVNAGHTESIRSIAHYAHQYFTASWDQTIRVWNAYVPYGNRKLRALNHAGSAAAAAAAVTDSSEDKEGRKPKMIEDDGEPIGPRWADLHPLLQPKTLNRLNYGLDNLDRLISDRKEKGGPKDKLALRKQRRQMKRAHAAQSSLLQALNEMESKFIRAVPVPRTAGQAKSLLKAGSVGNRSFGLGAGATGRSRRRLPQTPNSQAAAATTPATRQQERTMRAVSMLREAHARSQSRAEDDSSSGAASPPTTQAARVA